MYKFNDKILNNELLKMIFNITICIISFLKRMIILRNYSVFILKLRFIPARFETSDNILLCISVAIAYSEFYRIVFLESNKRNAKNAEL